MNPLSGLLYAAETRWRRAGDGAPLPRMITYSATDRCNARCLMCDVPLRPFDAGAELSAEEFRGILSDPGFRRLETLRITGGEPFLKADLTDIARAFREKTPLRILYVTTNGAFSKRTLDFVRAMADGSLTLQVQVSVDGVEEEQDRMRGVAGLYAKNLDLLKSLKSLKEEGLRFQFGLNQTILPENVDQMEPVARLAAELDCAHNIILGAEFHEGKNGGRAPGNGSGPLPFRAEGDWTEAALRDFYARSAALKVKAPSSALKAEGAWLRRINELYLDEGGKNRLLEGKCRPMPPCTAFFSHFRILPYGDLISCTVRKNHVAGNLRKQSFSELWRSEAATAERREVKACAGCWSECDITPSIFYSGDIALWSLKRALRIPFA